MLKNKLQIYLITYNRKEYLKRTFEQIFDENSPIKDFDITILNNCSTDGTNELIQEYCKSFSNITHIRHTVNIGGNANIARAFEMAASCEKEYFWILCDDDKLDFSNWSEVKKCINENKDIICVADYGINYDKKYNASLADELMQLSFVPAGIYKTNLIDENVLINMHQGTYTMFPQLCVPIHAINNNKELVVLKSPIYFNGLHCDDKCQSISYTRGVVKNELLQRSKDTNWILGYSNIITLLYNKQLQKNTFRKAILNQEIYGTWDNFYINMFTKYFDKNLFNYLFEIFKYLTFDKFFIFLLKSLWWKISFKSVRIHNKNKQWKKIKSKYNMQYWSNYFKTNSTQKYIDKLSKKYQNKKILLYGNGMISKILQTEYDLSGLNIVAITDRKFLGCDIPKNIHYNIISPNKIQTIDFDIVLIALKNYKNISSHLKDIGIQQKIYSLIK